MPNELIWNAFFKRPVKVTCRFFVNSGTVVKPWLNMRANRFLLSKGHRSVLTHNRCSFRIYFSHGYYWNHLRHMYNLRFTLYYRMWKIYQRRIFLLSISNNCIHIESKIWFRYFTCCLWLHNKSMTSNTILFFVIKPRVLYFIVYLKPHKCR